MQTFDHRRFSTERKVPGGALVNCWGVDPDPTDAADSKGIQLRMMSRNGIPFYFKEWPAGNGQEVRYFNAGVVHGFGNPLYSTESIVAGFTIAGTEVLTSP